MRKKTISLVGRPNVGKSSIFNTLIKKRKSIVDDYSGVTRDRIIDQAIINDIIYNIIDTGGITSNNDEISVSTRDQAELGISESDLVLFVVSAKEGVTREDENVAKELYRSKKPVLIVMNKADNNDLSDNKYDFFRLGLGEPIPVSISHRLGVEDLREKIDEELNDDKNNGEEEVLIDSEDKIRFSIIGRPNVGKSSIANKLLSKDRFNVSNIEGTTTDSVDEEFNFEDKILILTDTAGIKKRKSSKLSIEKLSAIKSIKSINDSEVILFVIDVSKEISEQDKRIAGYAYESEKPIIIIANKWDLIKKDNHSLNKFKEYIHDQLKFIPYSEILFISAKDNKRIKEIPNEIIKAYKNNRKRLTSANLNEAVYNAISYTSPPSHNGKKLKIYYATQVSIVPPTFVFFVNDPELVHFSYKRYLEKQIRTFFDFSGTPIKLIFRKRT